MRLNFSEVRLLLWAMGNAPPRADVAPEEFRAMVSRLQTEYHRLEGRANATPQREAAKVHGR